MEIIITHNDRSKYSEEKAQPQSLTILPKDKYSAITQSADVPRIPTISELQIERKITKEQQLVITNLSGNFPRLKFGNITPNEAVLLNEYLVVIRSMSRAQKWAEIKPFFNAVFNVPLGEHTTKMNEIAKRLDHSDYLPTEEWIEKIAMRILAGRQDLFKYNIDFNFSRFSTVDNSLEVLLLLMKAQKQIYPKRRKKVDSSQTDKFKVLIISHAELMIKLKLAKRDGEDYFGTKYSKIKLDLQALRSIGFSSLFGKPLSISQQSLMIKIIDNYRSVLDMLFLYNTNEKDLFNSELQRPSFNFELAALEAYHIFNDAAIGRGSYSYNNNNQSASGLINSIYNSKISNGISYENLKDFTEQYFTLNDIDRAVIKNRAADGKSGEVKKVIELFFETINKYTL